MWLIYIFDVIHILEQSKLNNNMDFKIRSWDHILYTLICGTMPFWRYICCKLDTLNLVLLVITLICGSYWCVICPVDRCSGCNHAYFDWKQKRVGIYMQCAFCRIFDRYILDKVYQNKILPSVVETQ